MGCNASVQVNQIPTLQFLADFQNVIDELYREVDQVKAYDCLLNKTILLEMIESVSKTYLNQQQCLSIIHAVLDYMAFSKNQLSGTTELKTDLSPSYYTKQLSNRYFKIKNEIYFSNKEFLKILSYISPKRSQGCFLHLKFDFSMEEIRKVAATVKEMFKYDTRSFAYLTNYLYLSCQRLEQKGVALKEIESKLVESLQTLALQNSPAPSLDGEQKLYNYHKSTKKGKEEPQKVHINFTTQDKEQRMKELNAVIEERVKESNELLMQFYEFKDVCESAEGFHFRAGVKAKSMDQLKSIERIKEKLLDKNFVKYSLEDYSKQKGEPTLANFVATEYQRYSQDMLNMLEKMERKVEFNVSDLLRGKCLFPNVTKINDACSKIIGDPNKRGINILEIDNRLKGETNTSDIVLKILVKKTVAELQLAINLNIESYQFSNNIYELIRSKFFSPLTMLKRFNEQVTQSLLEDCEFFIAKNTQDDSNESFGQNVSFRDCRDVFDQFTNLISFTRKYATYDQWLQRSALEEVLVRFRKIKDYVVDASKIKEILRRTSLSITFKSNINQYDEAARLSKEYDQFFRSNYPKLIEKIEKGVKASPGEVQILQIYAQFQRTSSIIKKETNHQAQSNNHLLIYGQIVKCLDSKVLQARNLLDLGNASWRNGNLKKAEEQLQAGLKVAQQSQDNNLLGDILIALSGLFKDKHQHQESLTYAKQAYEKYKDVQAAATAMQKMASAELSLGRFVDALKHIQECIEAYEKIYGKASTHYSGSLVILGGILQDDGKDKEALKVYAQAAEIYLTIEGEKLHYVDTIEKIADVKQMQGKLEEAKELYYKCLNRKIELFGADSIRASISYNNVAIIHRKLKEYEKSKEYFLKCLEIEERIKGKGHIETASTISNLAALYKDQKMYQQALEQYFLSAKIKEDSIGKNNLEMSTNYNNIGLVYKLIQNYTEAEKYYKLGLELKEKIRGLQSVDLIPSYNNLAGLFSAQNKYSQAVLWKEKARNICLVKLGRESKQYIQSTEDAAVYYKKSKDYEKAIEFYREAMKLRQKLGIANVQVYAQCKGNYSACLCFQQSFEEAQKCALEAIAQLKSLVVPEERSATCFETLGKVYFERKDYRRALQNYNIALKIDNNERLDAEAVKQCQERIAYCQQQLQPPAI